jgi:hypothetical protein
MDSETCFLETCSDDDILYNLTNEELDALCQSLEESENNNNER